jgi:hypothetical protein
MENCADCGKPITPSQSSYYEKACEGDFGRTFHSSCGPGGQVRLAKRPAAFRVKNDVDGWDYYDDERHASLTADRRGTEYQGLYVRDGT